MLLLYDAIKRIFYNCLTSDELQNWIFVLNPQWITDQQREMFLKCFRNISAPSFRKEVIFMCWDSWKAKLWAQRKLIDVLDPSMMQLLAWRMKACKNIGRIKIRHNLPIYVPAREKEILKKRQQQAKKFGFSEKVTRILSKAIMWESKRIQKELAKT